MMQWWADYLDKVAAKKTGNKPEKHERLGTSGWLMVGPCPEQ
jgi:hypothetical protein